MFKFAKDLPRFGYAPVVVTNRVRSQTESFRTLKQELLGSLGKSISIHETFCINKSPFRILSRLFGLWSQAMYLERLFFVPDFIVNWVPFAFREASRLVRDEDIDIVLTSSPPESVHLTGFLLKRTMGVKWIADFRDLWSTKSIVHRPPTRFHGRMMEHIERRVYRECDHVIANTEGNRLIYIEKFGIPERKITVITNGYDREERLGPAEKDRMVRNRAEHRLHGKL